MDDDLELFIKVIGGYSDVILGCTELPILWDILRSSNFANNVSCYDPVYLALNKIKGEFYE